MFGHIKQKFCTTKPSKYTETNELTTSKCVYACVGINVLVSHSSFFGTLWRVVKFGTQSKFKCVKQAFGTGST